MIYKHFQIPKRRAKQMQPTEMIAVGKKFTHHCFTPHKLAVSNSSLPIFILKGQGEQKQPEGTTTHATGSSEPQEG